jgi:hypothetical protein
MVRNPNWKPPASICLESAAITMPNWAAGSYQAHYSISHTDASENNFKDYLARVSEAKFSFIIVPLNIDGVDTIFVPGMGALKSEEDFQKEFEVLCGIKAGDRIYPYAVHFNRTNDQFDRTNDRPNDLRVR